VSDRRRQLGAFGERKACDHLAALGYEVIERNFRTRFGEIDIVASNASTLVFCEVKTRVTNGRPGPFGPLSAVGTRKRKQLRRMAGQWLHERSGSRPGEKRPGGSRVTGGDMRFDAIGVTLSAAGEVIAIEHVKNAF
jgi:putative endonuclease